MKNINDLIEEVKANPEFRAQFVGKDEEALNRMLKEEGYDVTMEEVTEAAQNIELELTPEELEKIAGGKDVDDVFHNIVSGGGTVFILAGTQCF